jgi:virginiamycin A acetyltransferase
VIQSITVNPSEGIKRYTNVTISAGGNPLDGFPLLSIDRDSYIVQAEIHSGINMSPEVGCHCIAIGKGTSVADGVLLIIDLDHDFNSVVQGDLKSLGGLMGGRTRRRGSIIMQNDVWVATDATIMPGVTLHNGCIVAAKAVVTKDVPPYAVVGGNPARVLRYRFDKDIIDALQKIAWWDWDEGIQRQRKKDFYLPVEAFVEKYLPQAEDIRATPREGHGSNILLFPIDVGEPFPLYPKVLEEYFSKDRPNVELLIYIPEQLSTEGNIRAVSAILEKYEARDSCVTFQVGVTLDEHILMQGADYYIATRSEDTVRRSCLADRYGTKVLYGTDLPLFPENLQ